jgi:hypothetical protein
LYRKILILIALLALPCELLALDLLLPIFALNAEGPDGFRRSTEIYLVNPSPEPVQVALAGFLPGRINRPAPCDHFMTPTRVIPPRSAVVWTASGLATDLGCADEVLGALRLRADGPIRATARMVTQGDPAMSPSAVLSGDGREIAAIPVGRLPGPTTLLVPAMVWHPNPCGAEAFSSSIGFANPGLDPVTVVLNLRGGGGSVIRVNGRLVALPHHLVIEPGRWKEIRLGPNLAETGLCLEPESFDLEVAVDGALAVYGTVTDRWSMDARTVLPIDLERN